MLFKNLLFAAFFAGKVISSPLTITVDIDLDEHDFKHIQHVTEYPYEDVNRKLEVQRDYIANITDALSELTSAGSDVLPTVIESLKKYSKATLYQAKNLPAEDLGEGETDFVQPEFAKTAEQLIDLSNTIVEKAADIKKHDDKNEFYRAFFNDRNAWLQFFNNLKGHLYKCDKDETDAGCEGVRPFNRISAEVAATMLNAANQFKALSAQLDL